MRGKRGDERGVEPEAALSRANTKFSDRFAALETHFQQQGRSLRDVPLDEMERQWADIKKAARSGSSSA